jgi:hypothetical protein
MKLFEGCGMALRRQHQPEVSPSLERLPPRETKLGEGLRYLRCRQPVYVRLPVTVPPMTEVLNHVTVTSTMMLD